LNTPIEGGIGEEEVGSLGKTTGLFASRYIEAELIETKISKF
jgi:hypothetical protein